MAVFPSAMGRLVEKQGSLYLDGKLLVTKPEIGKYGIPAVELALLRKTGSVPVALELLGEARRLLGKMPLVVKGVSFLEGSSARESQKRFLHHVLPLADAHGRRHVLDLVKFGRTIYGIFVDSRIVATNGMAEEPKRLVNEILRLAGAKLGTDDVQKLNQLLAKVASMKSSQDYLVLTVAGRENQKKGGIAT